jgi:aerobic-type carbon monoxide dehydrogenase small subunit (CoxS/CutS family)
MLHLKVNGKDHEVELHHPDTTLLWVLRDYLGLIGTKYGCGVAQCGACTVHIDGAPTLSCMVRAADVGGAVTTIEGIAGADGDLHPLQQAWIDHDVPQCGYCQSGQIMRAAALLADTPRPSKDQIDQAMAGNLCRCGTYLRIRRAIESAAEVTDEA